MLHNTYINRVAVLRYHWLKKSATADVVILYELINS